MKEGWAVKGAPITCGIEDSDGESGIRLETKELM
jgi:hypothetical protein